MSRCRIIKNVETGKVYSSIAAAARDLSYTAPAISWQIKKHPERWETIETRLGGHPVVNVATGIIYRSIRAAAIANGINPTKLWKSIKKGHPQWQYLDPI